MFPESFFVLFTEMIYVYRLSSSTDAGSPIDSHINKYGLGGKVRTCPREIPYLNFLNNLSWKRNIYLI
jgi:hypothetical protein